MINNLPQIKPRKEFVDNLWAEIETEQLSRNLIFEKLLNFGFKLSILLFIASNLIAFYLLNFGNASKKYTVEFNLTPMVANIEQNSNSILFVYDKDNNYSEVLTDFKIDQNKLYFDIKPGNYRIVFTSNKYKNIIVSEFKINNS